MTECAADTAATHIRSPADLVGLIPYLLGFHPSESVVVAEFRERRSKLGIVVRADMPANSDAAQLATGLAARFSGRHADGAAIVVYGSVDGAPDTTRGAELVGMIGAAMQAVGIQLCDAMAVGGGRWRSYFCTDLGCCPADGTLIAGNAGSEVAAAATVAGMVPLPDRHALVRSLEPLPARAAEPMARALKQAEAAFVLAVCRRGTASAWQAGTRERFQRAIHRARGGRSGGRPLLADREVARLLVGLVDIRSRDACWQDLDLRCSPEAFAVCWQLAQRSLPPYRSAPLFLLGWAAWRRGDGALARVAAERVLEQDVGYEAARLLLVALDHGLHPDELPGLAGRRDHPLHRRRPR
ncbi:MAG: hypothetical protein V7637_1167 [Mycobacteriales bacterium]|jgi:hypothetical protein